MSRRRLNWSAALRNIKADRAVPHPVREDRLLGTKPLDLSAWRGRSGRRYVVRINPVLEASEAAVVIAVDRDLAGRASILAVGLAPGFVPPVGTAELHVHRLADTDEDRAAVVADLAPSSVIRARIAGIVDDLIDTLDTLDGDADFEDGSDAEPSLGAPEGDGSQIGWMRGTDLDLEVDVRVARPRRGPKPDVIGGALMLLARPEAWCRGAAARDAAGAAVSPLDARAVAWCIMGAVERTAGPDAEALEAADIQLHELCNASPSAFNDGASTSHTDVVSLLRRAQASLPMSCGPVSTI